MREDARQWPVREELLLTIRGYCESSKRLEGDSGMDRVRRCCLLKLFQEGAYTINC